VGKAKEVLVAHLKAREVGVLMDLDCHIFLRLGPDVCYDLPMVKTSEVVEGTSAG
jgi:hypothetical protein